MDKEEVKKKTNKGRIDNEYEETLKKIELILEEETILP